MSGIFDQVINYAPPSLLKGTVTYKGTWSAATNTPTLINPPDSTTNGFYYVVSAAGTQFSLVFNIGDWIISNGSAWEKVDNTDAVSSVFGRTGAVVGVSTDYSSVGITATAVGASSPSTGAFTTLSATTPLAVASGGTGVASSTGTTNVVLSGSPTITTPVIAQINDASGNETLKLASIASAVNEVTIENAATGNAVHISATGGDASVGLHLAGKGASGYVNVQDSTDATKRIMFNASGGTTNTRTMLSSTQTVDRTLSLPDATDTLVGKATTDTLTNKTLTSPTLTAPILGTPASGNLASCTGYVGTSALVTVGALNSGSITSGFGAIDVGADAISGGAISGTTGTFTGHIATSQNVNDSASLSCTNASSGVSARARVLLIADAGNAQVFATSTGYTDITGAADSMVFAANSLSGGYLFSIDGNPAVAKITSTGLNSTAIGATTPSTGAFSTLSATGNTTIGSGGTAFLTVTNTTGTGGTTINAMGGPSTGNFKSADSADTAATRWTFGRDNQSTGDFVWYENGSARMKISTGGGLAVTGALSTTSTLSTTPAASANAVQGSGGSFVTVVALPAGWGTVHVAAAENGTTNVGYYQVDFVNGTGIAIQAKTGTTAGATTGQLTFQLSGSNLQARGVNASAPTTVKYWIVTGTF